MGSFIEKEVGLRVKVNEARNPKKGLRVAEKTRSTTRNIIFQ